MTQQQQNRKKLKIKSTSIPPEVSLLCWYLHQELGTCLKRLNEIYLQDAKASIYQHMKKDMVASTGEINLVVEVTDPEKSQKRIIIIG